MKNTLKLIITFLYLSYENAAFSQPGALDPSFSGDGVIITSFLNGGHASPSRILVQPDGKILTAGGTWYPEQNFSEQTALARYTPSGLPDFSFGDGNGRAMLGLANANIFLSDIYLLPDGKILGCGFYESADSERFLLARFMPDGSPDKTFDGDGIVLTNVANGKYQSAKSLALQSDGKIVVGGYTDEDNLESFVLLRYHPNGTLDHSFSGDGIALTRMGDSYVSVSKIIIQPDGKILVAGYAVKGGSDDCAVARYLPNGDLDASFGDKGKWIYRFSEKDEYCYDMALQKDQKIVLLCYSDEIGGYSRIVLARLNPNGSWDESFGGGDGIASFRPGDQYNAPRSIVLQKDGKILIGGAAKSQDWPHYQSVALRLDAQGALDPSFSGDGIALFSVGASGNFIYDTALQPDGKIVAVGLSRTSEGRNAFFTIRILNDPTVGAYDAPVFTGDIRAYPNPMGEQATLAYELLKKETLSADLYSADGRRVCRLLPPAEKTAGLHHETLRLPPDLPAGYYQIVVETPSGRAVLKVAH